MSLFRKPKKPIQRRVFSGYSDEEDIENNDTAVGSGNQSHRDEKMQIDDHGGNDKSNSHSSSRDRSNKKDKKSSSSSPTPSPRSSAVSLSMARSKVNKVFYPYFFF